MRAGFLAFAFAAGLALAFPAEARLSQADLETAQAHPQAGAMLPTGASYQDANGRATTLGEALDAPASVVAFVDYRCPDLCSPILAMTGAALRRSGLAPTRDYRLALIGFNPETNVEDARRMVDDQIADSAIREATRALLGAPSAVQGAAAAAGYSFTFDTERRRYAHPAALYIVNRQGRITRTLSALAATPETLRLALVEAASGATGNLGDVIALHCYGFDASIGFYADQVQWLIWATCGLTLVGGAIAMRRLVLTSAGRV